MKKEISSFINQDIWQKKYAAEEESHPEDTFRRVANFIADTSEEAEEFFAQMASLKFIPGGRILAYAGRNTQKATLSNCYVMGPIEDSMEGIMQALQESALTMKAGGGIGLDFSTLRPYGAVVSGTRSISSGPVSFMEMWNSMSKTISGVGDRKGAMIAVLRVDHPDIEKFIEAKKENSSERPVLEKFNISVGITDDFIKAVLDDAEWELKFNGKTYKKVSATALWNKIVENNWAKAEPGVIFLDTVNKYNNLYYIENITACNPCGEQPLPPYGACTLGSINLTQFVKSPFENPSIDWDELSNTVKVAVRFLDATVDKNYYPVPAQKTEAFSKRRVGLGIMGLGSMLAMLKIRYGSPESIQIVSKIMSFIRNKAYSESVNLAQKKGSFPLFDPEKYIKSKFIQTLPADLKEQIYKYGIRNSHLLTIAPTGSISQLVGNVSGGVEPIFHVRYYRRNYGQEIVIEDYSYKIYKEIFGETQNLPDYFVSAHELTAEQHMLVMAECQKYVDASISKTINLPKNITIEEMKNVYLTAWKLGLKGCTTYREGCLDTEILSKEKKEKSQDTPKPTSRPYCLDGKTYKVKLPENKHAYYLTFTHKKENNKIKPVELFISTKDPSVEEWTKALGRLVSAVFRNVENPTFLVEELKQIMGRSGFWSSARRKFVPSLIAEFGEVMNDYFIEIGLIDPEVPIELYELNIPNYQVGLSLCPSCGEKAARLEEGCIKCFACGYNKCG